MNTFNQALNSLDNSVLVVIIYAFLIALAMYIVFRIVKGVSNWFKTSGFKLHVGEIGFKDGHFNATVGVDENSHKNDPVGDIPSVNEDLTNSIIPLEKIISITQACMIQTLHAVNNIQDIKDDYAKYLYDQIDDISATAAQLCGMKYKEILLSMETPKDEATIKYYKSTSVLEMSTKSALLNAAHGDELSYNLVVLATDDMLDALASGLSKEAAKALKVTFNFLDDSEELTDKVMKACETSVKSEIITFINNIKEQAKKSQASIQAEENHHGENVAREISIATGVSDKDVKGLLNANGDSIWLQFQ